jgi:hypothetical protein
VRGESFVRNRAPPLRCATGTMVTPTSPLRGVGPATSPFQEGPSAPLRDAGAKDRGGGGSSADLNGTGPTRHRWPCLQPPARRRRLLPPRDLGLPCHSGWSEVTERSAPGRCRWRWALSSSRSRRWRRSGITCSQESSRSISLAAPPAAGNWRSWLATGRSWFRRRRSLSLSRRLTPSSTADREDG